jgi:hypothetical protein
LYDIIFVLERYEGNEVKGLNRDGSYEGTKPRRLRTWKFPSHVGIKFMKLLEIGVYGTLSFKQFILFPGSFKMFFFAGSFKPFEAINQKTHLSF